MPSQRILYGVLNLLGLCALLMIPPLTKPFQKFPPWAGFQGHCCCFVTRTFPGKALGFEGLVLLPAASMAVPNRRGSGAGFPSPTFGAPTSSLLPWFSCIAPGISCGDALPQPAC